MSYEENFISLGESPPPIIIPEGSLFELYKIVGKELYLSGHGPTWGADFSSNLGKIGLDMSVEQGKIAARTCFLNLMQTTRKAIGTLGNIDQIVEIFGVVNCEPGFTNHSEIINGCSELVKTVFGDNGKHTRVAIGANSLPFNFSVEIKMKLRIK